MSDEQAIMGECPKCGASGDQWCVSSVGTPLPVPHSVRYPALFATAPVTGEVGELVERLRKSPGNITVGDIWKAAAMLERYAAENARLREALEPFAQAWGDPTARKPDFVLCRELTFADYERARAALPNPEQPS